MAEFNIRTDAVDVEQIMRQIRTRIREKRGVDYTEEQIQELASVKLEKFLDPKGVRSDLVEQFRRTRGTSPPTLNYMFEDTTLFDSHRWIVRAIRSLLKPLLKLFFNPNMIIHALHEQSRINDLYAKRFDARDELDALYYEVVHNLVLETTRLGIEAKNLKMRVESMSSRLDFDERRARALEGVVQYRPAGAGARDRAREQPTASSTRPSEAGARPMETSARPADAAGPPVAEDGQAGPLAAPRRRRRRRGRRGRGNTPVGEGASASAPTAMTGDPHSGAAEPSDAGLSAEPDDDGPDEDPVPSDQ